MPGFLQIARPPMFYRTCFVRTVLLSLLLLLMTGQALSTAQAQPVEGRGRFLRWLYQDAGALISQVNPRTPIYLAGAAFYLIPASGLDPQVNPEVRKITGGAFGSYLDVVNEFGGPRMNLPVTALFAASLATKDRRFQDAAFTSFQSMLYAGVIGYTLKYAFGRSRPYEGQGAFQFSPFSGHTSFPSGHTTTAFAIVTPWVLYYPNIGTYALFAVCSGTAIARLERDKHWATDVLAGGTIGFLTAFWLTRRHQGALPNLSVTPGLVEDRPSLALSLRF